LSDTAAFPASNRSPNTSSDNDSNVTGSTDEFSISTVNVTVPPGSATEPGAADFDTATEGTASENPTTASSSSEAEFPSSSVTVAVTVFT